MAFDNFPLALQPILQQDMLDRAFQSQLGALMAYRKAAKKNPIPVAAGEVYIRSRAGRIAPSLATANPANNTGLDNGLSIGGVGSSNSVYPFEQFLVSLGMYPGVAIDLNVIQNYEAIASVFMQNNADLAQQAALSLDLICALTLHQAYESGVTWATAPTSASTTLHVDNIKGFDTAFQTYTMIDGNTYAGGTPQAVSATYTQNATVYPASGATPYTVTVSGVAADGTNTSSAIGYTSNAPIGVSGTLTFTAAQTFAEGDVLVAADAPQMILPGNIRSRYQMTQSSTAQLQMFVNAVAQLRRNNVRPQPDGTYHCFIDPLFMAQMYADPQFEILFQGQSDSAVYRDGIVSKMLEITFIKTTNTPTYQFTNSAGTDLYAKHAILVGDGALLECPFAGVDRAIREMADMELSKINIEENIAFVNRPMLDRLGQIISQTWYYVGGFVAPTDVTITPKVIPSATSARYKRAVVLEVASLV